MNETLKPTEFRLEASGVREAYDWLQAQNRIAQQAISGRVNTTLPLFSTDHSQPLQMGGGISFSPNDGQYELGMQIFSQSGDIAIHVDNRRGTAVISVFKKLSRGKKEEAPIKTDFLKIAQNLQMSASVRGYQIQLIGGRGVLLRGAGTEFLFHEEQQSIIGAGMPSLPFELSGQELFRVHTKGLADISFGDFEAQYTQSADVFKLVAEAIADVKGKVLSPQVLEIKPPRNVLAQVQQIERMLGAQEKSMMIAGVIDDDSMIQEISDKIMLETRPNVPFEEIGGLEDAKRELQTIIDGLKNPELFEEEGTYPPRGVLLYGPSGTGKTMLAKALATAADASFFSIKLSDVVHHLYGRSERLIAEIFNQARLRAPSVIFIDEIDALAAQRQYSTEVTSRIVSVLLTCLDGIEENRENIVMVGATNRPEAIDPALTRPGRLDVLINVPLPDKDVRRDIFILKMQKAEGRAGKELFDKAIDLDRLAQETDKMSPADIEELIRRVLVGIVRLKREGQAPGVVTTERIVQEIGNYEKIRRAKPDFGLGSGRTRQS